MMGRLGKAALKNICSLIAAGGGRSPLEVKRNLRWPEEALPTVAPSLILDLGVADAPNPVSTNSALHSSQ